METTITRRKWTSPAPSPDPSPCGEGEGDTPSPHPTLFGACGARLVPPRAKLMPLAFFTLATALQGDVPVGSLGGRIAQKLFLSIDTQINVDVLENEYTKIDLRSYCNAY